MNSAEFEKTVAEYQHTVISLIHKMVCSWDTARDLAQDAFIRLWCNRNRIDPGRPLFSFLYKISINLCIDFLRKEKTAPLVLEMAEPSDRAAGLESKEFYHLIHTCMHRLKPKQKAVFVLRDIEGLTFEEISEIMHVSVANLRSNLHLARKNIKNMLISTYNISAEYLYDLS